MFRQRCCPPSVLPGISMYRGFGKGDAGQMIKTKTVCDRCGKEIKGFPRLKIWRVRQKIIRVFIFFSPSVYDYIDEKIELCSNCRKEFNNWMDGKKDGK